MERSRRPELARRLSLAGRDARQLARLRCCFAFFRSRSTFASTLFSTNLAVAYSRAMTAIDWRMIVHETMGREKTGEARNAETERDMHLGSRSLVERWTAISAATSLGIRERHRDLGKIVLLLPEMEVDVRQLRCCVSFEVPTTESTHESSSAHSRDPFGRASVSAHPMRSESKRQTILSETYSCQFRFIFSISPRSPTGDP